MKPFLYFFPLACVEAMSPMLMGRTQNVANEETMPSTAFSAAISGQCDSTPRLEALKTLLAQPHQLEFEAQLTVSGTGKFIPGRLILKWHQSALSEGRCEVSNTFLRDPVVNYQFSKDCFHFSAIDIPPIECACSKKLFQQLQQVSQTPVLPFEHLLFWMFGLYSPSIELVTINYKKNGMIAEIRQRFEEEIWQIHFTYPPAEQALSSIPTTISILHLPSGIQYRLRPLNFNVDETFYHAFLKSHGIEPLHLDTGSE